jgi:hypothetical protein
MRPHLALSHLSVVQVLHPQRCFSIATTHEEIPMPKTRSKGGKKHGDGRSSPGSGEEGLKTDPTRGDEDAEGAADLQPDDVANGDPAR